MMSQDTSVMNRIFFLILILGLSVKGYSQIEISNKFKAIPPKSKEVKIKPVVPPIPGPPKVMPYVPTPLPENNFIVPKNEIIVASKAYRRNQDLGIYKTNSKTAKVEYRDGAYVDGDRIRIYVNFKVVDYEVILEGDFKGFEVKLEKGVNRIDFEALNEGFAAPNTAEYRVYDDKGKLISASQWNIGQGYMATIIVEKE
ncbi:hypothetical protein [Flavobacterium frigoris]|uniref:Secreted protein n=1 Tax=Flavobacterium frigoris (strain PS1) TaxID=1086011 RepID=H7FR34_FLAFP|nr:hypothetical protein [Flavobacterium frigoris]EIA09054.1 hypothetical protein HJ01_01820 [Flavobacterium frigoris PS1]